MINVRKSLVARLLIVMCIVDAGSLPAVAQPVTSEVQVFFQLEGNTPDWLQMDLSVARLDVGGIDPVTGKRFLVTAFEGEQLVSIPRDAEGSPRFIISGPAVEGLIDRILVTLNSVSLMTQPPGDSQSPKVVPVQVRDNALKLRPPQPFNLTPGDVVSVVAIIQIGKDAVLTKSDVVALNPTYTVDLFVPVPENYLVGSEVLFAGPPADFQQLGVRAKRAKALNESTGEVRNISVDERTGAPVSFSDLRSRNEAAWRSEHGALTPALVQKLETLSNSDTLAVDIWVAVPGSSIFGTDAESATDRDVDFATFLATERGIAEPVLDELATTLSDAGATIESIELTPPVLHVTASRAVLEQAAPTLSTAVQINESPNGPWTVLGTNASADLVQAPLQLAHFLGYGMDLRMALVEPEACVNTTHEAFQNVFFEPPISDCPSGTAAHAGHSTAVAGALAAFVPPPPSSPSTRRPPQGQIGLFQGRMFFVNGCNVSEQMIRRDGGAPHLVNLSCHAGTEQDPFDLNSPYLDYAVFTHRMFVANGSGNIPSGDPTQMPVACWAYNALCVGAYGASATYGVGNFGDDVLTQRYVNRPETGREKPDLVGPTGSYLPAWNDDHGYYLQGNQTSFSTPMVTGTAALLMANFGHEIVGNPTLTRAVLMASASHSFSGYPPVPLFSDAVDDRAGAGAPRGDRAKHILQEDQYFARNSVSQTADFDSSGYLRDFISFNADPGDKVRIVMTYDQCMVNTNSTLDKLQADLDMIVLGDGTTRVNNSLIDNTEMLEFTSSTRSSYNVKVKAQHWDACSDGTHRTHLAIAWDVIPPYEQ
jgi:hypothetical protein